MRIAYVKSHDVVGEVARSVKSEHIFDGGHDSFVQHFLKTTAGNDVLLLAFMHQGRSHMSEGRVQARVLPLNNKVSGLTELLRALVGYRPDVTIVGEMGLAIIGVYIASLILGRPYVATCHNRLYRTNVGPLRRLMDAATAHCLRRAAACICHGPYLAKQLRELGIPQQRIVEFDWPFHFFRSAAGAAPQRDLTDNGAKRVVAFLGRLEAEKGVFDLLEAMMPRLKQDPSLRLVYLGKGTDLENLRNQIHSLGMDDQVLALGGVSYQDVPPLLRQAILGVTPTQSTFPEGRPMANMEVLALGLPAVAPDYGPFPFAVDHNENGLLFTPNSVEDLRAKIFSLLDDPELYSRLLAGAQATSERFAKSNNDFSWALKTGLALAGTPVR